MTEWRPVSSLTGEEKSHLLRLLPYGEVSVRAQTVYGRDYDPVALAAAEKRLKDQQASELVRAAADPAYVMPLRIALPGQAPWLSDVPMISGKEMDVALPADVFSMPGFDDEAWRSGNFEYQDLRDNRRTWFMEGLQVSAPGLLPLNEEPAAAPVLMTNSAPYPRNAELAAWAHNFYERTGGMGGRRDWRRDGSADLQKSFPGVKFKADDASRIAGEQGLKRTYNR